MKKDTFIFSITNGVTFELGCTFGIEFVCRNFQASIGVDDIKLARETE